MKNTKYMQPKRDITSNVHASLPECFYPKLRVITHISCVLRSWAITRDDAGVFFFCSPHYAPMYLDRRSAVSGHKVVSLTANQLMRWLYHIAHAHDNSSESLGPEEYSRNITRCHCESSFAARATNTMSAPGALVCLRSVVLTRRRHNPPSRRRKKGVALLITQMPPNEQSSRAYVRDRGFFFWFQDIHLQYTQSVLVGRNTPVSPDHRLSFDASVTRELRTLCKKEKKISPSQASHLSTPPCININKIASLISDSSA